MVGTKVIVLSSRMRILDSVRYGHKDFSSRGKRKILSEGFSSYSYNRDHRKLVEHKRLVDRGNNRYYELVTDPDTCEVLYDRSEKTDGASRSWASKMMPNHRFDRM